MTEHPIIFSGPIVRAISEGRKSMTRRVVSQANSHFGSASRPFWGHTNFDQAWIDGKGSGGEYLHVPCHRGDETELKRLDRLWASRGGDHGYRKQYPDCGPCEECDRTGWRMTSHRLWPKFEIGNRLWVRETWRAAGCHDHLKPREIPRGASILYEADCPAIPRGWGKVRSSRFICRWMARHILEVTDVRVERVQEISEADALAEGIEPGEVCRHPEICGRVGESPLRCMQAHHFLHLWDSINGKKPGCSWDDNPFVWVIGFRRVEQTEAKP